MSGTQQSGFANQLFDPLMAGRQQFQINQLAEQQQTIGSNEVEMAARIAGTLMDKSLYPTPEARAAAYPTLVGFAQQQGFLKKAPTTYPGDEQTMALSRMGTSSADLYKTQMAGSAIPTPGFNTGAPTGGGGTSTAPAVPPYGGGTGNVTVPPDYMPYFQEASQRTGIPVALLIAQARQESGFNPGATGGAGEVGIMQIHPNTAANPGFGLTGVANPAALRDPRANINFGADYLAARAKAAGVDFTTPAGQAAALRAYNGGGDPEYARHVFQYMPGTGGGTATATAATTSKPVILGDSLASPGGVGGSGVVGAGPVAVRDAVRAAAKAGTLKDQPVVLSSGVSNNPGAIAAVEEQLQAANDGVAASVKLLGVGPGIEAQAPGTNAKLQALAQKYGAEFVPLPPSMMMAGGVHPTPEGYAALRAIVTPSPGGSGGGGGQGGRTQVAGPGAGSGAATAAPAAPSTMAPVAIPAPPEMDGNHLTRQDYQDLDRARRAGMTGPQLAQEVQQRQGANLTRQERYYTDVRQAQNDALARQDKATEQARQAEELRLRQTAEQRAEAEAAQKAKQAANPFQGTGMDPQWQNILDAGDDGSARYARAYTAAAAPKYNVADGSWVKPNMAAYDKPTYIPKGMTEAPDYSKQETPTPTQMSAPQSLAAGFADRMRNALPVISDTSDAAMSRWQILLGKAPVIGNQLVSSEFQQHMQAERDFINATLRRESGAAIQPSEFAEARAQYIPQPGDQPAVLAQKAKNRETVMANLVRDAGPAYKPAEAPKSSSQGGWSVKRID